MTSPDPDDWVAEIYQDDRGRRIVVYRDDSLVAFTEGGRRYRPNITPGMLRAGFSEWARVGP